LVAIVPYLAVLGSIFTFVYSMYLFFGVFGPSKNNPDDLPQKPKEVSIGMLIAPMILVFGVIIIGIVPNMFNNSFLVHAATSIKATATYDHIQFWHGFNTPFIMSLVVVIIGAALFMTREKWMKVYNILPGK